METNPEDVFIKSNQSVIDELSTPREKSHLLKLSGHFITNCSDVLFKILNSDRDELKSGKKVFLKKSVVNELISKGILVRHEKLSADSSNSVKEHISSEEEIDVLSSTSKEELIENSSVVCNDGKIQNLQVVSTLFNDNEGTEFTNQTVIGETGITESITINPKMDKTLSKKMSGSKRNSKNKVSVFENCYSLRRVRYLRNNNRAIKNIKCLSDKSLISKKKRLLKKKQNVNKNVNEMRNMSKVKKDTVSKLNVSKCNEVNVSAVESTSEIVCNVRKRAKVNESQEGDISSLKSGEDKSPPAKKQKYHNITEDIILKECKVILTRLDIIEGESVGVEQKQKKNKAVSKIKAVDKHETTDVNANGEYLGENEREINEIPTTAVKNCSPRMTSETSFPSEIQVDNETSMQNNTNITLPLQNEVKMPVFCDELSTDTIMQDVNCEGISILHTDDSQFNCLPSEIKDKDAHCSGKIKQETIQNMESTTCKKKQEIKKAKVTSEKNILRRGLKGTVEQISITKPEILNNSHPVTNKDADEHESNQETLEEKIHKSPQKQSAVNHDTDASQNTFPKMEHDNSLIEQQIKKKLNIFGINLKDIFRYFDVEHFQNWKKSHPQSLLSIKKWENSYPESCHQLRFAIVEMDKN